MAENEDGQERSEQPTARHRLEARNQGRIAKSVELSAAVVLLAGATAIAATGGASLAGFARRMLRESAGALSGGPLTMGAAADALRGTTLGLLAALAPFVTGVAVASIAIGLVQTRGLFTTEAIQPKFSNLNPVGGLKKILSWDAVINLLKALVKLIVLGLVTVLVLRGHWGELLSLVETGPLAVIAVTRALGLRLVFVTGFAFLVVALLDYWWQSFQYERGLKMTKQEVRTEHRETEGDPVIKARIRSMQMARARQRMLQAVPKADVVVTNPTHVAVAIQYDPGQASAPIVVAMGERKLAERIKKIARESGVPCVENKPVARALLATCKVGRAIPPALYAAVAEILAYVFRRRAAGYGRPAERRAAA